MDNNNTILEKINAFTQSPLTLEQVYIFNVILCDNEIDRDFERFSDDALLELKEQFIGKTGIFDHNAKAAFQSARIFDTEIISDSQKTTTDGREYKYLKASVYMVRTDSNKDLISEIDGGIKKEVSISCSAKKRNCSICGCDKTNGSCNHEQGATYSNKVCHIILSDISDAYEWSFVAVPAQVNAGVTKRFYLECDKKSAKFNRDIEKELRRDIIRLAFIKGGENCVRSVNTTAEFMDVSQLLELKKSLDYRSSGDVVSQLSAKSESSVNEFLMG